MSIGDSPTIDFAITAQSLENWTAKALVQRDRRNGLNAAAYRKAIAEAVPMQAAFRDIANTAKHGDHRDQYWLGEPSNSSTRPASQARLANMFSSTAAKGRRRTGLEVFEESTNCGGIM
ncbi:hypothetical protein ABIB58_001407 [Brevundimonas sp. UYEF29]|uniref:hypothetical protein n=1 Tax=unclassified Brevundimonas TaxID=2622653 RepID=UPI003395F3E1